MAEPGIKGTLFQAVVEDLQRLREAGRISEDLLEARLEAPDLALLEQKISPTSWYDIFAYHRMVDLLCEAERGNRERYWFERGRRAAKRLIDMNIYQQLDYLGRTESSRTQDPQEKFLAFGRDMKLLMSLHASMLNFGNWRCLPDPDHAGRYRVEIRGVAGIPDGVFVAAAGLFSGLGETHSHMAWEFERPAPDLVIIRMRARL